MNSAVERLTLSSISSPAVHSRIAILDAVDDSDRVARLRAAGHEVECLPLDRLPPASVPIGGPPALQVSYRLMEWLRTRSFDVVCVPDTGGPAYYSLLARGQGLAFAETTFCLILRGPTLHRLEERGRHLDQLDQLECDALERRCLELADAVVVPDIDVLDWLRSEGRPMPCRIVDEPCVLPRPAPRPARLPLVSVCLVHHDRPALLRQALVSLERQDYPHVEIVLVDDGSRLPVSKAFLNDLEPVLTARGHRLIRQPNLYLGAARNAAARHARGEYLLFMDDDNLARPHEVSAFVRAAVASDADILTTFMDFFDGDAPPREDEPPLIRWLFAGTDSLSGIARNCYGDANALVRRSVFEKLGGFTEDRGTTHEDWEFFARAVLNGFRLEIVPEALFRYRRSPTSMLRTTDTVRNYARALRPWLEDVPAVYRDLIRFAQGAALLDRPPPSEAEKPLRYRIADAVHSWLMRPFRKRSRRITP